MPNSEDATPRSALKRFFGNPIVGISGSIASVLGIFLSIYFFLAGREHPELTYFVHPAKAAVFRVGQSSRLSVKLDEQPVTSDVTAAQIAFWNEGRTPIREGSILKPLVIRTQNRQPILDVEVRKTSREIVKITLNRSRAHQGEVEIRWNILEQNDGAVIQVVYEGDERVKLEATATVEGQADIAQLDYGEAIPTPNELYSQRTSRTIRILGYFLFGSGVLSMIVLPIELRRKRNDLHDIRSILFGLFIGQIMFAVGIYALWGLRAIGPPFGF